jgi:DNA processing protein
MSISLEEKQLWAAILAVDGIGRKSLRKILLQLKDLDVSLRDFWQQQSAQIWQLCGLSSKQQQGLRSFKKRFTPEDYIGWLGQKNISLITNEDERYPKLLKNIDDRPLILYVKGSILGVNKRPIAVVGTRKISGYGRTVCEQLVPELVASQATIVSGFMYGVDTCAHQQAVAHDGYTVGVLGYGFDHLYPAGNKKFFSEMLAKGNGFITEYPPWVSGHRGNFPERNRIVAGMSLAVLVIEAGKKSGSHITAGLAGEYGRGVCAVPGPITNHYSEGTKWLVNQGARLVTSAREVLEEAGVYGTGWSKVIPDNAGIDQLSFEDEFQQKVYQFLLNEPLSTNDLAKQLDIAIPDLNTALSLLELEGYLQKQHNTWFVTNTNGVQ